jgi:hypothetical protein
MAMHLCAGHLRFTVKSVLCSGSTYSDYKGILYYEIKMQLYKAKITIHLHASYLTKQFVHSSNNKIV